MSLNLPAGPPKCRLLAAIMSQNSYETAFSVKTIRAMPKEVSMTYGRAEMSFISETTEVQEVPTVWQNILSFADDSVAPSEEFIELFRKNCSVFESAFEASRRTVIDLFLREIVSQFPEFQVICEYDMMQVNEAKRRRLIGRCDYVICHRGSRNLPLLIVTEAKCWNTESRLQCIGECASIHYRKKQARMANCSVYGIISTGRNWEFVFINQEGLVSVSMEIPLSFMDSAVEGKDLQKLRLIYRLVHYVIHKSYINSPRTTPNVSSTN